MRNAAAFVCFLILVLGFGDAETLRPRRVKAFASRSSVAAPPQATVPLGFQVISVGEVVTGTLTEDTMSGGVRIPGVPQLFYQLTAPSDGTLIVTLDWDPSLGPLALIGQSAFVYFRLGSPTVVTLSVVAGRTYWLPVVLGGYYYEFPGPVPFVLTTSLEPCKDRLPVLGWVCVNGGAGWVPHDHPLALPPSPQPLTPVPPPVVDAGACPSIKPGADWICASGNWVPPGHPLALTAQPNPAPPSSPAAPASTCTGPDPFLGIPGLSGVCVNGGWVPIGHPLARGGG